jgi:GNAT superfamily N-acetyltransferase
MLAIAGTACRGTPKWSVRSDSRAILLTADRAEEVYEHLRSLEAFYPCFEDWFFNRVVPGLSDGTRTIIGFERDGRVKASAIVKRSMREVKLCTIFVERELQKKGLGVRLFRLALDWLNEPHPLATVSEERLPEFRRLFDAAGFTLSYIALGYYRPGKREYVYNGVLRPEELRSNELGAQCGCSDI